MAKIKHKANFLKLFTVSNGDHASLAISEPKALHDYHYIHAVFHLAEDPMLAIHPFSFGTTDKKLGIVCIGSNICHAQAIRTRMIQDEILLIKFLPIDGISYILKTELYNL